MKLNPQCLGNDNARAIEISTLEVKFSNLAAVLGTRQYFERHDQHSKMTIYDYEHPDLEPLKEQLTELLLRRPAPPRMVDNSWWTFLGCISLKFDAKLPMDIRKLLYQYYVKDQYPETNCLNLYNRPIYNLTIGRKWFHGLTAASFNSIRTIHTELSCIKPFCNGVMRFIAYSHSKLAYEAWMDVHVLETHGVSMVAYLHRNKDCSHHNRKAHRRLIFGDMFYEDAYSKDIVCVDCGHLISTTVPRPRA